MCFIRGLYRFGIGPVLLRHEPHYARAKLHKLRAKKQNSKIFLNPCPTTTYGPHPSQKHLEFRSITQVRPNMEARVTAPAAKAHQPGARPPEPPLGALKAAIILQTTRPQRGPQLEFRYHNQNTNQARNIRHSGPTLRSPNSLRLRLPKNTTNTGPIRHRRSTRLPRSRKTQMANLQEQIKKLPLRRTLNKKTQRKILTPSNAPTAHNTTARILHRPYQPKRTRQPPSKPQTRNTFSERCKLQAQKPPLRLQRGMV
jgi:hypothetical protein